MGPMSWKAGSASRDWPARRTLAGIAVVVLTVTALAAGRSRAAPATPGPAGRGPVAIVAREFLYEPKQVTVRAGEVVFSLKNTGVVEHDFVVESAGRKQVAQAMPFAPGKSVQVKATLTPGTYTMYCSIPGHREAGMAGTVTAIP